MILYPRSKLPNSDDEENNRFPISAILLKIRQLSSMRSQSCTNLFSCFLIFRCNRAFSVRIPLNDGSKFKVQSLRIKVVVVFIFFGVVKEYFAENPDERIEYYLFSQEDNHGQYQ